MDTAAFTEQAMRPPQEAQSMLLRATQGCTYNACAFCYVSRGYAFLAAAPERLEAEAAAKKPLFPADTAVYLTGSNPFSLPAPALAAYLAAIRRQVPAFAACGMQSMVRDIAGKSREELRDLRALGLSHLYVGVENGNDDALRVMRKGHTAREALEQLLRLEAAGIEYTAFYILGMGGRGQGRASGLATAALFNRLKPRRISTTGLTVFPGAPLAGLVRQGAFTEATEKEKVEELLCFLENLRADTFFDAVHYLNPLTYRFHTASSGKNEAVADIRDLLATHSEDDIELMVNRGLMRSL